MKIWKYSGIFLIATGILHIIVAIAMKGNALLEIIKNGIQGDSVRSLAFWFLFCGVFVIFLGQMVHCYIKSAQRPAPSSFGYALLIVSIIDCFVVPVSGFWLFLPQALIIIICNLRHKE